MFFAVESLLIRAALVTALILPGMSGLVQGEQLDELRDSYEQTLEDRQALVTKMRQLETEYEDLVDKIDRIKSEGTDEIRNRYSVEQLLSRSRTIAEKLERRQKELTEIDGRISKLRTKIVAEIDGMIAKVEQRLGEVAPSKRKALVDQLNELRQIRKEHRSPLPEAPGSKEVSQTLRMASGVQSGHPEQMSAAADELEDTEDQVRKRLDAIDKQLRKLEEARTLSRRAQTFQSEEQFFDEESRARVIGRHEEKKSASTDDGGGDSAASGSQESSDPTTASGEKSAAADQKYNAAPDDSNQGDNSEPALAGSSGGTRNTDSSAKSGFQAEASDRPESASQAPGSDTTTNGSNNTGGSTDPFASENSVVLESDADPSTSVASGFASDSELESRIERLKEEQQDLEQQADRLEEKATELRQRARDAKQFE